MGHTRARHPQRGLIALVVVALTTLAACATAVTGTLPTPGAGAGGSGATVAATLRPGLRLYTGPVDQRTPPPPPTARPTPKPTPRPKATSTPKPKVTAKPAAKPTPAPTPDSSKPIAGTHREGSAGILRIDAAFFGKGVSVRTYAVSGASPRDVIASILANGPKSAWAGDAEAQTQSRADYRYETYFDASGTCRARATAKPPVRNASSVILPAWQPGKKASPATVAWWNAEILRVAVHERVHVRNWTAALRKMNALFGRPTCAALQRALDRISHATNRLDCAFDMAEYGKAAGLTLEGCLRR